MFLFSTENRSPMFDKLIWHEDRIQCGDLVFRLEPKKDNSWDLGDQCLLFYKDKPLVDQYERWFSAADRPRKNILELGIWDGGSTALWFECLRPTKHVAID